jgi:heme/copper-type cytochrome/quinol oxidase subunit 2
MKNDSQKNMKTVLIVIGCVVVIVLGMIIFSNKNTPAILEGAAGDTVGQPGNTESGDTATGLNQEANVSATGSAGLTPYERQVEALKTASLTKADMEESLGAGLKEKFKVFNLRITADGYIPNAIIVEKGDAVQLNMTADEDADIQSQDFNFFVPIPAKEVTNLGFIANKEGTFVFYCRNQCLGKDRIFGHIVVRPRS